MRLRGRNRLELQEFRIVQSFRKSTDLFTLSEDFESINFREVSIACFINFVCFLACLFWMCIAVEHICSSMRF
jgi:hypothetical protein